MYMFIHVHVRMSLTVKPHLYPLRLTAAEMSKDVQLEQEEKLRKQLKQQHERQQQLSSQLQRRTQLIQQVLCTCLEYRARAPNDGAVFGMSTLVTLILLCHIRVHADNGIHHMSAY